MYTEQLIAIGDVVVVFFSSIMELVRRKKTLASCCTKNVRDHRLTAADYFFEKMMLNKGRKKTGNNRQLYLINAQAVHIFIRFFLFGILGFVRRRCEIRH